MSQGAARSRQTFEWTHETAAQPSPTAARRVLMIDDDPVMRKLIIEMLGHRYQVMVSSNGLELPRLMTEFVPDLVLLDVMMPWVNGLQICRTIKSNSVWKKVPIIFISGRKKPADVELGMKQGADAYLTKPFSMVELLHQIQTLLNEPPDELF